jgi:methionine-rich copper-binding protein CopC
MKIYRRFQCALLPVAAMGFTPAVAEQTAPSSPHAGHMAMPVDGPMAADPHAHHHHMAGALPASPLGPHDARFDAVLPASVPQNGAMLDRSPPMLSLIFPVATTIHQVALTNAAGQRIPVAATLPTEAVTSFNSPLVRLDRGAYKLVWRGSTTDSETGGTLDFSVR